MDLHSQALTPAGVMSAPRWWVEAVKPSDYATFATLFTETFGAHMEEATWRWKYAQGRGHGLFTCSAEGPVAHYGALSRAVLFLGQPTLACQPVDVLVRPKMRGVLTRRGPMFLAADHLLHTALGAGKQHLLGFGFPTARHLTLGERLGLFIPERRLLEVRWPVLAQSLPRRLRVQDVRSLSATDLTRHATRLWEAMAADLCHAIVGVRDADWLRYRYLQHPQRRYELLAVYPRLRHRPLGLLVVRQHPDQRLELLDILAPLTHIPALLNAACEWAERQGHTQLYSWISEPFATHFMHTQTPPQTTPLDIYNVAFTRPDIHSPAQISGRWWLMAGDTDFR
ncbi:GNAT family N-acetyltransferase [Thiorhodospira sibirica]|uniref:GNAT family N-acetyltransferase n=1 Tax=Thiorhodospira sibirica TaxID=154347 RepID=UPI00022C2837|nr:GNAT family N-acetyltransferase [Thiorhodospira sibirica]